jgi:hypothetical protein
MSPEPTPSENDKGAAEEASKGAPPRFRATLPMNQKPAKPDASGGEELDLDLGDIQSRLPYGSEDIADK